MLVPGVTSMLVRPLCCSLALLALLAGCSDEPEVATADAAYATAVRTRYPAAERLVALGDIHGDLDAMRQALWLAGVLDEDDVWVGGDTVVVQTGDVLDRGDDEQAIIDLLEDLQAQAKDVGGALHLLHGNHELMNVAFDFGYVTDAGFADFEDAPGVDPDDPAVEDFEPGERARASAFMPGGSYAKKLASHPVVLVVGDTAFAHGGVLPSYATEVVEVNREVNRWLRGLDDAGERIYRDEDSPVWSRHYSDAPSANDCRLLDEALVELGVDRMVVGHTMHDSITSACDDKVWLIDTGMSAAYGGHPEILEMTEDAIYVVY